MGALTFDDLAPETGTAAASATAAPGGPLTFDDLAPNPEPSKVADAAKAAGAGYLKGAAGLVGLPADAMNFIASGGDWLNAKISGRPYEEVRQEADARALVPTTTLAKLGGASMVKRLEDLGQAASNQFGDGSSRTLYEPHTATGKVVERAAEFVPGVVLGAGGRTAMEALGAGLKYGALPGAASEIAGQATEGSPLEGPARIGAALATGGALGYMTNPSKAQGDAVRSLRGLAPTERDAVLNKAQSLIDDSRSQAVPIPLSTANAIDAASGGRTNLSELQRQVEGHGGMMDFYAGMPEAVDTSARAQFDRIVPRAAEPATIGPQAVEAARAGVAATPEGTALADSITAAGSRVTPEQAGRVIQPELRGVYDRREGVRAKAADKDYAAARASGSWVPVEERMVDVARTADRPMTPAEIAAQDGAASSAPAVAVGGGAPLSLSQYVARNGGLSLEGGDAAAAGFDKWAVPGFGRVARPEGKSIDSHFREKLIEDGYLPHDPDGGMSRDIREELFTALQNEKAGQPTYSAFDFDKVQARAAKGVSAENAEAINKARSDIIRDHYRAGVKPADLDPAAVEKAAQAVASGSETDSLAAYNRAAAPRTVAEEVTEKVPQTVYGQVNPNPVIQHIDSQLERAKGSAQKNLREVRAMMFGGDGVEASVEGLHNARTSIDELIDKARANAQPNSVRVLMGVKGKLDEALEQVPEYARANARFQKNSAPLKPFDDTPAIGAVIAKDEFGKRFTTPAEKVPGTLQQGGASTSRAFNDVATPGARKAYERHLTTQMLDRATDAAGNVSADTLRTALRDNADLLANHAEVRDRLMNVAIAREGLDRIQGTTLGRLAKVQPDVKEATRVLFPTNPTPGSAGDVAKAVGAVADKNAWAARQLVRVHAEGVFNEATQALQSGPNVAGGAKFASTLRGNPQQAENLEAAVRALPDGETVWKGFDRFLDVLEATGRRQNVGSKTEYNRQWTQETKKGGVIESGVRAALTGGLKLPAKMMAKMEDWRLGRNVDELARLFSDPDAIGAFRGIVNSSNVTGPTGRLVAIASRAAQDSPRSSTNQ